MSRFTRDYFDPKVSFTIEEASGEVDGKSILAKVKGEFFVPNGVSRNNRFYPSELWEKALASPAVQKKLSERRMLGTIGHDQSLDDRALLEGKISHIVTALGIQNGKGLGEAVILNTPAGQMLNTLLRANCKLFVSSRAEGGYNGDRDGMPVVDPESYVLETFDFVTDPGFLQANPGLVESMNKILDQSLTPKGANPMQVELVERVTKENITLREDISKIATDLESTKNEAVILGDRNKQLSESLKKSEREIASLKAQVENFKKLADNPREIDRVLEVAERNAKLLKEYAKNGTPAQVDQALDQGLKAIREYKAIGTPKKIREALDKSKLCVSKYKAFGTIGELNKYFDLTEEMHRKAAREAAKTGIAKLAKELNVTEARIAKVWGKMPEKDIRELFKDVSEAGSSSPAERYRKAAQAAGRNVSGDKGSKNEDSILSKPRALRIMEAFS